MAEFNRKQCKKESENYYTFTTPRCLWVSGRTWNRSTGFKLTGWSQRNWRRGGDC